MPVIDSRKIKGGVCGLALLVGLPAHGHGESLERSTAIVLAAGTVDVSEAAPAIPEGLDVAAAGAGAEDHLLVKFSGLVTAAQLEALERRVERIYA